MLVPGVLAASCTAPAAANECLADPEALVAIGDGRPIPLRPGASGQLRVTCQRCCWVEEPVDVAVSWSFQPATAGRIDARSGAFALAAGVAPGSRNTVLADFAVGGKTRRVENEIVVIDPAPQPWAGMWRETARLTCTAEGKAGRPDSTPADEAPLIREFSLNEDGTFDVTWFPFERYKDFWGTYIVDRESGAVAFTVTGGNAVPPEDADLTGSLKLVPGEGLVISDLYFGAPHGSSPPPACGHRFGG